MMRDPLLPVRTRFAPSPTGFLHIGGVRTALFSWAFARKHHGKFILRIEDTDLARSTPESVTAILEGMQWSGLDYDEGPFYQMQRMPRYREVLQMMLEQGLAYYCYCSKEELEAMREAQRAKGEKPRYDGRWRDSQDTPPLDVHPVIRFKNPLTGVVGWEDQVKGRIEIDNTELDDLIIARPDGTPTYNFCVVVDDWDMQITHVIRGDDHVNNTPRQINILKALGAKIPLYAHLPMILREDGQKMSKRHDAVSVVEYAEMGFLPEALLNYLARLGWGHGDDEVFSMQQFVEWFDLADVSPSAARFDKEKLLWLNQQHMKKQDNTKLAEQVAPFLKKRHGIIVGQNEPALAEVVSVLKERTQTLVELADAAVYFYRQLKADDQTREKYLSEETQARLLRLREKFMDVAQWQQAAIHQAIQDFVTEEEVKMGQVGMPLRVLVCGTTQTPSIDVTLWLLGKETVLQRMSAAKMA
jgi:glutamyl-tRNA synthetase